MSAGKMLHTRNFKS